MRTTDAAQHQAMAAMNPSAMPTTQARLRNSCDACNTAKVKCSKERPCCRRCERKELFCVYSVSLRCSKRPVDGRNASTPKSSSTSSGSTHPSLGNDANMAAHLPLDAAMDGTMDGTMDSTSLYDFESLSALSEVNFDLNGLDEYFTTDTYLPPTNFNAYANTTTGTPPAQQSLPPSLSRPAIPLCGCQQHILSKLSELSLTSSSNTTTVPFDRALSENRAIVALCTSTLDCSTCARSDDVTLILTLSALLAHVLGVFETLFRNRREALHPRETPSAAANPSPPESVASASSNPRNTPTTSPSFLFPSLDLLTPPASLPSTTPSSGLNTPHVGPSFSSPAGPPVRLSLGSYELDERDEFLLQTSLLKIELGKITALVEAFEARLCQTKLQRDLVGYLKGGLGANYDALKRLAGGGRAAAAAGFGRGGCLDI